MEGRREYHLVHIISNGEYTAPLLATQVFDRAQAQAEIEGYNSPLSVSVWIIEPMSHVFDQQCRRYLRSLRKRCPGVSIKLIGGLSRLKNWPSITWLSLERKKLGPQPVVYHCRGESSFLWGNKLAKKFSDDATVLDIRGFWPLERLAPDNVFDVDKLTTRHHQQFDTDVANLRYAISQSNMVTTVGESLKEYLVKEHNAPAETYVIPCCVAGTIDDKERIEIRDQLNLKEKKAVLYLGGAQKYQHLEDLVLPFVKSIFSQRDNYVAVFITQDIEALKKLVTDFNLPGDSVRIIRVPQSEVSKYLSAMDAGLLLRAPSFLNTFSQPVKLGEYLSAGLPVIVERGTGNVERMLTPGDIGFATNLAGKAGTAFDNEVKKAIEWMESGSEQRRNKAKQFVEANYTWAAHIPNERDMYANALNLVSVDRIKVA
jgi:glycosyltransferase involved in cell wall biosynthesis